jgi:hypothetical protein
MIFIEKGNRLTVDNTGRRVVYVRVKEESRYVGIGLLNVVRLNRLSEGVEKV